MERGAEPGESPLFLAQGSYMTNRGRGCQRWGVTGRLCLKSAPSPGQGAGGVSLPSVHPSKHPSYIGHW